MKRGKFQPGLFQFVFDSSSLINIKNLSRMNILRARKSDILVPQKVAEELTYPRASQNDPLNRFVLHYPGVVTQFQSNEEIKYLEIRSQFGIHDGEAAAITIALKRQLPLVTDDQMALKKAKNHNISVLDSEGFLR